MNNFSYYNPVKIVFGSGSIAGLAELLPDDTRIMLLYGGGSIKTNGVYDKVKSALCGKNWCEFSGIEPNPLHETCMRAIDMARNAKIGFLLAVGGGSVLDASKYIAAGCEYRGDPWDILAKGGEVKSALPIGCVLTLPATGSEVNEASVISRASSRQKLFFSSPMVFPRFSILDPETTYSLPLRQTVNGIVDAFIHVTEQYVAPPCNAPLQARQAEAVLLTLLEEAPKVLVNPSSYDGRANIMWAASHALNRVIGCGVPQDWMSHLIGHELTAFYGIDHAQSLAIVLPSLWRQTKSEKQVKLAQLARRVYGVGDVATDMAAADLAIIKTERFFHSLGMKTRLSDYGIDADDAAQRVSERMKTRDILLGDAPLASVVIAEILRQAK
ncbi:MAG: iron-containing alcohol dehydrogenase [bacterium]